MTEDRPAGSGDETSARTKRRTRRFDLHLPVALMRMDGRTLISCVNFGRDGMFLIMEDPPPVGHLLHLVLHLPEQGKELNVVAKVIWRRHTGEEPGQPPGVGLEFQAMDTPTRRLWTAFVDGLSSDALASEEPDIPRRVHPRAQGRVEVRLESGGEVQTCAARNISEGGVFVEAHTERLPGDQLTITLVQPETGEEIALDGTVAAVQVPPGKIRGLGIRFLPLSAEEREQLRRFIFGRDE